mmetsp:Transcript_30345/g.97999  ORF Transcript_30345/g.97999 Transcript_30345/m.97999 type:complete len:260 (-) Transcript_30345:432-1211(-)
MPAAALTPHPLPNADAQVRLPAPPGARDQGQGACSCGCGRGRGRSAHRGRGGHGRRRQQEAARDRALLQEGRLGLLCREGHRGDDQVHRPQLHDPIGSRQLVGRHLLHAPGAERRARRHGRLHLLHHRAGVQPHRVHPHPGHRREFAAHDGPGRPHVGAHRHRHRPAKRAVRRPCSAGERHPTGHHLLSQRAGSVAGAPLLQTTGPPTRVARLRRRAAVPHREGVGAISRFCLGLVLVFRQVRMCATPLNSSLLGDQQS